MKKLITNYTFNASFQTITFTDYTSISHDGILLITNVTDNIIIYNFADPLAGGTVSSNILTLIYDTSTMDNSDNLQIFYDDGLNQVVDISQLEILLRQLIESNNAPSWYQYAANALQTILITGSTTAVSTCATLTTITNIGGVSAAGSMYALDATQWSTSIRGLLIWVIKRSDGQTIQLIDENGTPYGVKHVNYKPRVYLYDIAEGNVTGHTAWTKIGYSPTVNTTESSLWSLGGLYTFPTAAFTGDVVSSSATDADAGVVIKSGTADAGGSTTSLVDAAVDFTTATAVEIGDCVILDKSGTTPEWGYVTVVAANTLTIGGGFSAGGTVSAGRTYSVIDYNSAGKTGAHAVKIEYLTSTYVEKSEIVILNGDTAVNTINTDIYRINSFRVIAGYKAVGNLSFRVSGGATTYSYITAGFTRSRNNMYTVPINKTLYVTQWSVGWAAPNESKVQSCRFMTKANMESSTKFKTGALFYPYTEIQVTNAEVVIHFDIPTQLTTGIDLMINGIAATGGTGPAVSVLRGWLEDND